jgi:hypothetical protein
MTKDWNWKIAYTCNELGVCQGRNPRCAGCSAGATDTRRELPTLTFPFAPGVIDGYPKPENPALTKWLVRWVWLTIAIAAVCFLAGLLP